MKIYRLTVVSGAKQHLSIITVTENARIFKSANKKVRSPAPMWGKQKATTKSYWGARFSKGRRTLERTYREIRSFSD